jgi:hypothetical protein
MMAAAALFADTYGKYESTDQYRGTINLYHTVRRRENKKKYSRHKTKGTRAPNSNKVGH